MFTPTNTVHAVFLARFMYFYLAQSRFRGRLNALNYGRLIKACKSLKIACKQVLFLREVIPRKKNYLLLDIFQKGGEGGFKPKSKGFGVVFFGLLLNKGGGVEPISKVLG